MSSPYDWRNQGQSEGHEAHRQWPPPDYSPPGGQPAPGEPPAGLSSLPPGYPPGPPPQYGQFGSYGPYGQPGQPGQPGLPGQPAKIPAPGMVQTSMWLWLAACVLYLGGWVLAAAFDYPHLRDELLTDPEITDEDAGPVAGVMLGFAVIGAFLSAVPYVLFAVLARVGRSWARVTMAVLGGLGLLVLLVDVLIGFAWRTEVPEASGTDHAILVVLAVLSFALTVAAMVTMFVPSANRYYREVTESRRR